MKLWTQWLQAVRFLRPACHRSLTFLSIGPCQGAAGPPPGCGQAGVTPCLRAATRGAAHLILLWRYCVTLTLLRNSRPWQSESSIAVVSVAVPTRSSSTSGRSLRSGALFGEIAKSSITCRLSLASCTRRNNAAGRTRSLTFEFVKSGSGLCHSLVSVTHWMNARRENFFVKLDPVDQLLCG